MVYNLRIDTPYNTIYLLVDDIMDLDVEEIIHQPWVKRVWYRWIETEVEADKRCKRLVKVKEGDKYGK